MKKVVALSLLMFCLISCKNKIENVERAFYYWKSDSWRIDDAEDSIINNTKTKKIYVKFFEVEHNELMGNVPYSKSRVRFYNENIEIIPTVFIKNEVFTKSSLKDLDLLADNINFLISKITKEEVDEVVKINELQMDCDWTLKTRDNYFYFLKKIKNISNKKISCTLRLYPYKYRDKMGIPPVDSVTLMCYNLLNPLESKKQNSILDVDELSKYLNVSSKYPLHLDVALPIYSWIQVYQNNQFKGVVYNDIEYVIKNATKIEPLWFEMKADITIDNYYLRVGDKLKYEEIDKQSIHKAIEILKKNIDFDKTTTVTLFHLDDSQLKKYSNEEISSFYTAFSK